MRVVWTVPALNRLDEISDLHRRISPAAAYRVVRRMYRVGEQVDVLGVVHTARDWPESFGDG